MLKLMCLFCLVSFALVSKSQTVSALQGRIDLNLPKQKEDQKKSLEWQQVFQEKNTLFLKKNTSGKRVEMPSDKRKKSSAVASNARAFSPQNDISSHPLMPEREKGKLNKTYVWDQNAQR